MLLKRIGYWHIYATRPDWKIEPLGDEGPRTDLKDETRRIIDIIAQATKKTVFINYSDELSKLHGVESYYSAYRWGWALFSPLVTENKQSKPLPLMDTFGKDYFGQSYIRQNWKTTSTFMTFRAGNSFAHHGHYDNGHISLFKGSPLLVNSSIPGKYYSGNRLNYSIRTIAKNSILVQRANETVHIAYNQNNDISDGGQRVPLPLGSAITTVNDWFEKYNKKPVLAGGEILLINDTDEYAYVKSDLTKAYNSSWYDDNHQRGKLEKVEREVLYLRLQDTLLIKDTVKTKDKNQVKVVFHTMNKPIVEHERILKGDSDNGIISSTSKQIKVKNNDSFLTTEVLSDIKDIHLVGGEDYKFYVETDGDDTQLNGNNFSDGLSLEQIKAAPGWRIEINSHREEQSSILTVHRPSMSKYRSDKTVTTELSSGNKVYTTGEISVIYSDVMLDIKQLTKHDFLLLESKEVLVCGLNDKKFSACEWLHSIPNNVTF